MRRGGGRGRQLVADLSNGRIVVFLGPREAARAEVGLPATATDAELEHRKAELEAKRKARAEVGLPRRLPATASDAESADSETAAGVVEQAGVRDSSRPVAAGGVLDAEETRGPSSGHPAVREQLVFAEAVPGHGCRFFSPRQDPSLSPMVGDKEIGPADRGQTLPNALGLRRFGRV